MSDKRSVATDALETLGTIIDSTCKRDAIHLAVEPCVAAENLYPGQHIGILDGKATTKAAKKLGIVDPFISGFVPGGQKFWLIVYPRQITSLRHVWTHPDFEELETISNDTKAVSEAWLREFCRTADCPDYDAVIAGIEGQDYDTEIDEEYLFFRNRDAHGEIPDEFWAHMEIVLGRRLKLKPKYFSCSC